MYAHHVNDMREPVFDNITLHSASPDVSAATQHYDVAAGSGRL